MGIPFTMNFEQGSTFGSKEYVFLLASKGISQSMDERARWKDNALVERWFQTLKSECLKADKIQHACQSSRTPSQSSLSSTTAGGSIIRLAATRRKNGT